MIKKYKKIYSLFPSRILGKRKIDKNKDKNFIFYCENNKINWILFRNIIEKARYHFRLDPILYLTDSIGFEDVEDNLNLNPYNPTFNILTKIDLNLKNEKFIHTDINGIKYTVWWDELKEVKEKRTNLFLFTSNILELKELIQASKTNNRETVILYLTENKNKTEILPEFDKYECWQIKYSNKALLEYNELPLLEVIKKKLRIKTHKKLKKLRNKILTIMSQYYPQKIVPSYYNDEDSFEKFEDSESQIISLYENKK